MSAPFGRGRHNAVRLEPAIEVGDQVADRAPDPDEWRALAPDPAEPGGAQVLDRVAHIRRRIWRGERLGNNLSDGGSTSAFHDGQRAPAGAIGSISFLTPSNAGGSRNLWTWATLYDPALDLRRGERPDLPGHEDQPVPARDQIRGEREHVALVRPVRQEG